MGGRMRDSGMAKAAASVGIRRLSKVKGHSPAAVTSDA